MIFFSYLRFLNRSDLRKLRPNLTHEMKKLVLLFMLVGLGWSSSAQIYNMGFGVRAGVTNFLGDIGGGDLARNFVFNMELKDTRWATGVFWRYRFHPLFAAQVNFGYERIQGRDINSENYARRARNLNFRNDMFDLTAKLEYYPQALAVSDVGYRGIYRLDYQTYFLVGVGGVLNRPKADYLGNKDYVKLRPLMTEGEKYSPIALTLPLGGGFFFTYNRVHRYGFEFSWNWTFTDYLDDISDRYVAHTDPLAAQMANQYVPGPGKPDAANFEPGSPRGDPTDRDNYLLITVSYSYLIRTRNSFYRNNYSWMYGRKKKWGGTKAKF